MGAIVPNGYPTHVRVSESQFVGLNVEILFSLAISRKPYKVQGVGGSYVKATRASSEGATEWKRGGDARGR